MRTAAAANTLGVVDVAVVVVAKTQSEDPYVIPGIVLSINSSVYSTFFYGICYILVCLNGRIDRFD